MRGSLCTEVKPRSVYMPLTDLWPDVIILTSLQFAFYSGAGSKKTKHKTYLGQFLV